VFCLVRLSLAYFSSHGYILKMYIISKYVVSEIPSVISGM